MAGLGIAVGPAAEFSIEACLFALPQTLAVLFPGCYWHLVVALLCLACTFAALSMAVVHSAAMPEPREPALVSCSRKIFIENCRGFTMLQTYLSIFAVDFSVYARRFAKTETTGVSLVSLRLGSRDACPARS